jgi:hypothetical protein
MMMIADGAVAPVAGQGVIIPFWGIEGNIAKQAGATTAAHSNIWLDNDRQTYIGTKGPPYKESGSYTPSTVFAITYYTERMMYVVENGNYTVDPQGFWKLVNGAYVPAGTYTASTSGEYALTRGVYKPWSSSTTGTRYNYVVPAGTVRYRYENGELNLYRQRYVGNSPSGSFTWQFQGTVARHVSSPSPFYIPASSASAADTRYVGVSLSTRDPKSTNRGYLATSALLDTEINYRSRIAIYQ